MKCIPITRSGRPVAAASLVIEMEDFHDGWFAQRGNLGKAYELFGDRLQVIIADMNKALTA